MHQARDALIDIYGSHAFTHEAHASQTYRRLVASHDDDDCGFHRLRALVESLTEHLRATVPMHDSPRAQVQGCLEILFATKNSEKHEMLRDLALRSYEWSETHRHYFTAADERIRSWRSYFLSFTDRAIDPEELNQINRNHRYFILDVVPNAFARSTGLENYLAAALH